MTRSVKDKDPLRVRNFMIWELHHKGYNQDFIARVFGITSARVCQVLGDMS
jgi:hypothetical protein